LYLNQWNAFSTRPKKNEENEDEIEEPNQLTPFKT
jgi:hypothetical protein